GGVCAPAGQVAGLEAAVDQVGARPDGPSREQQQRHPRAERYPFHSLTVLGEVARGFPTVPSRAVPSAPESTGSRGLSQQQKTEGAKRNRARAVGGTEEPDVIGVRVERRIKPGDSEGLCDPHLPGKRRPGSFATSICRRVFSASVRRRTNNRDRVRQAQKTPL